MNEAKTLHAAVDNGHDLGPSGLLEILHLHFKLTGVFPAQTFPSLAQGCSQICKAETSHPSSCRQDPASCIYTDSAQFPGQHTSPGLSASPVWHPQEQPWRLQHQDQVCVVGSDDGSLARAGNSLICIRRVFKRHCAFFLKGLWCHEQLQFVEISGILQLSNFGTLPQAHWRVSYVMVR